jgi:hypothetical protein
MMRTTFADPDSPEAVALELMRIIREAEGETDRRSKIPPRAELLTLYAECLSATNGRYAQLDPPSYLN